MSLLSRSNQYGKVLGDWNIRKEIGKGSKGTVVYQIVRKGKNWEEVCALKAIPIISERGGYGRLSDHRKEEYQKALSERTVYARLEVQNMLKVRGRTNIVDYFDHTVAEWEDENEFGCDLLIRMELLHDLRGELKRDHIFSEAEVIQIGRDICSALVVCHGKGILHRDIKPENIFFNNDKDYKLGDFGISRIMDRCPGSYASTGVGTPEYAAPEQGKGQYNKLVDIYSLGLVLYELTNQNRLPFAESSYVRPNEVEKRIHEKTLPVPCNASDALGKVILKACAHDPADRYQSAQEMLDALNQIGNTEPAEHEPSVPRDPTKTTNPDHHKIDYETKPALPDSIPVNSGENSDIQQSTASEKICVLFEKASVGDASAQNSLGQCYYDGTDVERNYVEAVKWFQMAAEQGDGYAEYMLAKCYDKGVGVDSPFMVVRGTLMKYAGKDTNVSIPPGVQTIGARAFCGCSGVVEVSISQSITAIKQNAFRDCVHLTQVVMPPNMTSIGYGAFYNCTSLLEMVIPDGITKISENTFWNCKKLCHIKFPESLQHIAASAFRGCTSLASLVIPDKVNYIGDDAFRACTQLIDVIVPASLRTGSDVFKYTSANITISKEATEIASEAFLECTSLPNITIPKGVTYIGDDAFADCRNLTSIVIPEGILKIGARAFAGCAGLTNLVIPDSVLEIGAYAFGGCTGLTNLVIPDNVLEIGGGAFQGCSNLTSVAIPNRIKNIDGWTFCGCSSLTEIVIPDSVLKIGTCAFMDCTSLTELAIPDSVLEIGAYAFGDCTSLTNLAIPDGNIEIKQNAFVGCNLTICTAQMHDVAIHQNIKYAITSIIIPDGVDEIKDDAFAYCETLTKVTIPEGVTKIGNTAFVYCSSLVDITIPKSMRAIGMCAFHGCECLRDIIIPENVKEIDYGAFNDCAKLTNVIIREGVTMIFHRAFENCPNLASVTIPRSVTSISDDAFLNCPNLTIYTPKNSYAHRYAKENNIFVCTTY